MTALQRHQLAWLTDAGWRRVLAGGWDVQALDCLSHWARQRLPLVVTRQRPQGEGSNESEGIVCLGLPAPGRWGRRRLALSVAWPEISHFGAFPAATALPPLWAAPLPCAWRALCAALADCGTQPRVYGSHGWQLLTGLDHVRPGSDVDLCIAVDGPGQADAVAALLSAWPDDGTRLDGELVFDTGAAVAWREWAAWRARRTPSLLVKQLDGVALAHTPFWRTVEPA